MPAPLSFYISFIRMNNLAPRPRGMPHWLFGILAVFAATVSPPPAAGASATADPATEALFVRRVWPLFQEKCLACHGNDEAKIKGGLDMRTLAATLKGGDSEKPALVP